jgi:4'-phosphopantetheinyl transferase
MIYLHSYSFNTLNKKEQKIQSKNLLIENIAHYLEKDSTSIQVNYNENGKPFVEDLFFSISHSKNQLVQAFTFLGELGLDIEFINPNRKLLNLAKKYYHEQEYNYLKWLKPEDAINLFYSLWTTKEAVCKEEGGRLWYYLANNYLNKKNTIVNSINDKNIIQIDTFQYYSCTLVSEFQNNQVIINHE